MLQKPRILIVDDEPAIRTLLHYVLDKLYAVDEAPDGATALQHVVRNRYDAVLLDVSLPDMSGYQVCEAIQRLPEAAQTPVVFCTGRSGIQGRIKGYDVGGAHYVVKPFSPSELLAHLGRLLPPQPISAAS
jgi:DNA-binding response OmpR family regulator